MPTEKSAQMQLYVPKRHLYFCDKYCNFTYRLNNKRLLYTCIIYWYFWVSYKIITSTCYVPTCYIYSHLRLSWTSMRQYYKIWARNYNASLELRKVSNGAKIRNRYNQVPHLTQDTNGKVTNSQKTPQTRAKKSALSQQVTTKHI